MSAHLRSGMKRGPAKMASAKHALLPLNVEERDSVREVFALVYHCVTIKCGRINAQHILMKVEKINLQQSKKKIKS